MSWWARDARKRARSVLRFAEVEAERLSITFYPNDPEWRDYPQFFSRLDDGGFAMGPVDPDAADYLVACGAEKIIDGRSGL